MDSDGGHRSDIHLIVAQAFFDRHWQATDPWIRRMLWEASKRQWEIADSLDPGVSSVEPHALCYLPRQVVYAAGPVTDGGARRAKLIVYRIFERLGIPYPPC